MIDITKPGVHQLALSDFEDAKIAFNELRMAKHAVSMDCTYDDKGRLEQVRLHHYLTCIVCERERARHVAVE